MLVKMIRYDGHKVDVHPSMVDDYRKGGYVAEENQSSTSLQEAAPIELGTDSGDQFSDEQLRGAIEVATGKKPHWKASRETLISQFNDLNAKAE